MSNVVAGLDSAAMPSRNPMAGIMSIPPRVAAGLQLFFA
jgi:hypothetical protein